MSTDVLDLPGVIVTDGNAASYYVSFRSAMAGLSQVLLSWLSARVTDDLLEEDEQEIYA